MARPGLTKHRKFVRLARMLGSQAMALGCLEFMWEACYENGDEYLGDVVDVESAAHWEGESGKLLAALVECGGDGHHGFVEEIEGRPGRYICHDLFHHAPNYVQKRRRREMERQAKGVTLSDIRSDSGRKGASERKRKLAENSGTNTEVEQTEYGWSDNQANGRRLLDRTQANGDTPAPAPAPAPAPNTDTSATPPLTASADDDLPGKAGELKRLWNAMAQDCGYPKIEAWSSGRATAFRARMKDRQFWAMVPRALEFLRASQWHRENPTQANIDTFLRPGRAIGYAEKAGAGPASSGSRLPSFRSAVDDSAGSQLETIEKNINPGEPQYAKNIKLVGDDHEALFGVREDVRGHQPAKSHALP